MGESALFLPLRTQLMYRLQHSTRSTSVRMLYGDMGDSAAGGDVPRGVYGADFLP